MVLMVMTLVAMAEGKGWFERIHWTVMERTERMLQDDLENYAEPAF